MNDEQLSASCDNIHGNLWQSTNQSNTLTRSPFLSDRTCGQRSSAHIDPQSVAEHSPRDWTDPTNNHLQSFVSFPTQTGFAGALAQRSCIVNLVWFRPNYCSMCSVRPREWDRSRSHCVREVGFSDASVAPVKRVRCRINQISRTDSIVKQRPRKERQSERARTILLILRWRTSKWTSKG